MSNENTDYQRGLVIFALVTDQGTAMPETAMCADHVEGVGEHLAQVIANAFAAKDWNGSVEFVDCSGNDQLHCLVCGRPEDYEQNDGSDS